MTDKGDSHLHTKPDASRGSITTETHKDQRRSRRMLASVPLDVQCGSEVCISLTAVINLNGALLLSPKDWPAGTSLHLKNRHTEKSVSARIVWAGQQTDLGSYKLGVEFESASTEFWGDDYNAEGEEAP